MKKLSAFILLVFLSCVAVAQKPDYSKMSPLVRRVVMENGCADRNGAGKVKARDTRRTERRMLFLARIDGDAEALVARYDGLLHAQLGRVSVVSMPVSMLGDFSQEHSVQRMEASGRCQALLDTTAIVVDALPVYAGTSLPQAYTGRGVVMGVMDIGFDLTHPTFFDATATNYRIKALWDQLDNENGNENANGLPIGKEYVGTEALLALGHSLDGVEQTHGTHTTGIAAGSGYDTPYRGMAWESDICLVANATSNNAKLIPESLLEMYNSTMDILGFKYIFDYAESVGKPCVISFSEGSTEDLEGEDNLIYEALEALIGPGRIIVASAGNTGDVRHYFRKPVGMESMGAFVQRKSTSAGYTFNTNAPFDIRMVVYSEHPDTIVYHFDGSKVEKNDTLMLSDGKYVFLVDGHDSPYFEGECSGVVGIVAPHDVGYDTPFSVEVLGKDADVELFATGIELTTNSINAELSAGDCSHGIHSPGSAPCVICVGANGYRLFVKNYMDDWHTYGGAVAEGKIAPYSSLGPTFDRRVKPDVVAPGLVVSAHNSYHLEASPNSWHVNQTTMYSNLNGRRYGWCADLGTSMSTPVVGGAVALWLEANPNLTPEDVFDIIRKTSRHTDTSLSYPNNTYGYGEIDVYAGLVEALKRTTTGLESISTHQPEDVTCRMADGHLSLRFLSTTVKPVTVSIYSTSGALVTRTVMPSGSDTYSIDLSSLSHGIYAVQIGGKGSLLIRI